MVLYSGHFFGCGFYFIAKQEIIAGATDTWIHAHDLIDSSFS